MAEPKTPATDEKEGVGAKSGGGRFEITPRTMRAKLLSWSGLVLEELHVHVYGGPPPSYYRMPPFRMPPFRMEDFSCLRYVYPLAIGPEPTRFTCIGVDSDRRGYFVRYVEDRGQSWEAMMDAGTF